VPEVASGAVEIVAVVRRPGIRTKVAVASISPELDALRACVGFKGRHVNQVVADLGEPVDLISWSDTPEQLVRRALAPALVRAITLDVPGQRATAYVAKDQLDLARGKHGENVTLASDLSGWAVEVIPADAA
jgi:N utilization substance protein A